MRGRADQVVARAAVADLGDLLGHLLAHELAALTGLGPLGHLDLQLVGVDQVFGIDAEPAARDLADAAAEPALAQVAVEGVDGRMLGALRERLLPERAPGALGGVVAAA